jgi:putative oxidoreductase
MKKAEIIKNISQVTTYLLIFLFTYSGINKLVYHGNFESSILQYPIIRSQAGIISWIVPITELALVILLLVNKYRQLGSILSLILITVFTLYITYMILFIPDLPCSCGGILQQLSWRNHLLFNSIFILLLILPLLSKTMDKLFIAINRNSRIPV